MWRSLCFLCVSLLLCGAAWAAEIYEPKPGSAERTAIMDAMREPVSRRIGTRVTFTGTVKVTGPWAVFHGNAAPTNGKTPKGPNAEELELDFFALLQKRQGTWVPLHWGFAGDIGVMEEAKAKYPAVPKELFNSLLGGRIESRAHL
jgi:hypothetical protein